MSKDHEHDEPQVQQKEIPPVPAAEMVGRALTDQRTSESINLERQQLEFNEVTLAMFNDKEWMKQANGALSIIDQEVRAAKVSVLLRHMAVYYKVGFDAGRAYERAAKAAELTLVH